MAKIVTNKNFTEQGGAVDQVYNALDCCLTSDISETLQRELAEDRDAMRVYTFERSMQGPAFTMMMRGMTVDAKAASEELASLIAAEERCRFMINELSKVWGREETNPHSPKQVKELIYEECLEKPYHTHDGAETVNEDALEDITIRSPVIGVLCQLILRARGLRKAQSFVAAKPSPDGKVRSFFSVGATKFGRWSSQMDPWKLGLNFFNLPKKSRRIIVPSRKSRVLVNVDLKQAESFIVAWLSNDKGYIKAHKGDAHTAVACDLFGCKPEEARVLIGPGGQVVRQVAKKVQHGTNYGLGERHAARMAGLRVGKMRELRRLYFSRYNGVATRIKTMPARLRDNPDFLYFSGRPHRYIGDWTDEKTVREALSGEPQGGVADLLNVALYRLWRLYDGKCLWLLNQNYDSILFECERSDLAEVREKVEPEMVVWFEINGERLSIASDWGEGDNWAEASA